MAVRRILVAVDFSERSEAALRYAVELARELGARIDVLHVVPPPSSARMVINAHLGRELPRPDDDMLSAAESRLGRLCASIAAADVPITRLVEQHIVCVLRQDHGDKSALPLTAREFVEEAIG